ncbi:hypothetical protein LRR18_04290 [Mangrovimonas sp. AS39]|uniref:hypothetical protein n=1 Tax=Mangrovimonas futianensis TaxID=2895523 RepID=UPI001E63BA79|nr:hypothetical protein [Mangrovimonas futianensis]MCF1190795.1 hypothetical protein [Mangrovimonas futianensis]MCF1194492.1 hypothetical protein [Mangrovimonas futianensis]
MKKKIVLHTIGFIAVVFLVLLIFEKTLSFFVSKSTDSQTGKVNLVLGHNVDPEVAIFGSSVAEVGFDANFLAENLNASVYNLAIDGTPILKSEFLIEEFVNYSENCKSIVIGLAFFSFSEQKGIVEPSRYIAHKSNRFLKDNIRKVAPDLYKKLYYRPFYSIVLSDKTYYKNAMLGLKSLMAGQSNADPLKGFVPHYETYNDTDFQDGYHEIGINEDSYAALKNIIQNIQNNDIEVSLVVLPMFIEGQNKLSNYKEYIEIIIKLSKETNCRLFDFSNHQITHDNSNYYNNGHLNKNGARKFTESFYNEFSKLND